MELSENKEPRFKNRGLFATPTTQAALPWPSYLYALLRSIFSRAHICTKKEFFQRDVPDLHDYTNLRNLFK